MQIFDSLTGNVKSSVLFSTPALPEDDSSAKTPHKALPVFCAAMVAAGWAVRYNKGVPRETQQGKGKQPGQNKRAGPVEGDIMMKKITRRSFLSICGAAAAAAALTAKRKTAML